MSAPSEIGERRGAASAWAGAMAAVALLTRVPMRRSDRTGAAWFPLVGAALGMTAAVPAVVLAGVDALLAGVLAVAVLTLVTGALHLDGLADTADALLAPDAARAEAARTDPRIGVGGLVAVVLLLAADAAALSALARDSGGIVGLAVALVVASTVSRLAPVLLVRVVERPEPTAGFGAWFATRVRARDALVAALIAGGVLLVGATVGASPLPILVGGAGLGAGLLGGVVIVARRGGLDGDVLGATIEWTQAATLVIAVLASVIAAAPPSAA